MDDAIHIPQKHWTTSSKARLQGAKSFVAAEGIRHTDRQLFRHFNVPQSSGRRILQDSPRQFHHNPYSDETRGRNKILQDHHINAIERLLWTGGYEARSLPWASLLSAAGCDFEGEPPSTRTIRRVLYQKDWRKCIACSKGWTSKKHAEGRVAAASRSLLLRPTPEDWEDIRWSDECHFSFGPEGKHKIIRTPGERECPDCIQYRTRPTSAEETYRCHCWAAIGYNFKSQLVWYTTKSKNGAITQRDYIDQILDPVVKPWLNTQQPFILEEDGAFGHGPSGDNIVAQWKGKHKLQFYFNTPGSPDLSPIENAWKAPKAYLKEHAIWDQEAIKDAAEEGWEALTEDTINNWVHSMPQRMKDVLKAGGQLIAT
jgi:hypothetical protein